MTLYVRADVASVSVPVTSGGCGQPHSRPVVQGATEMKPWPITCASCETDLKQDILRSGSRKIRTQNLDAGLKLADRFLGLFGATEDTIPETPDEERHREARELKAATDQAAKSAQLAETSAASLNSIAAAIQGNSELMTKFLEFQEALMAQHQPVVTGPRQFEYTVGGLHADALLPHELLPGEYRCQECSGVFRRTSNKGPVPKRCPDCKAKVAA